jgi:N,N'-diacetyllegionaminate synthase
MKTIRIGKRTVGGGAPCYIIAEAGSNHNGKLEMALRLIDVAVRAGADAVKFQTFRAARLYTPRAGNSKYLKLSKPIYEIIRDMEMPYEWIPKLAAYCRKRKIQFLSTPFDEESADRLAPYVDAFKIASYELSHHPLVKYVADFGKPVLLSTGAATESEVAETVAILRRSNAKGFALMQCTASYPAPLESLHVRVLQTYRQRFGIPTGLSDHSRDPVAAPMTAAALGADLLEKHFTLRNDLPGPDHRYAITPPELALLVRRVREVEAARGRFDKHVDPVEKELRHFARRSLFAIEDIAVGDRLTRDNIAALRNGSMPGGLPPSAIDRLLGRRARRAFQKGYPLTAGIVGR